MSVWYRVEQSVLLPGALGCCQIYSEHISREQALRKGIRGTYLVLLRVPVLASSLKLIAEGVFNNFDNQAIYLSVIFLCQSIRRLYSTKLWVISIFVSIFKNTKQHMPGFLSFRLLFGHQQEKWVSYTSIWQTTDDLAQPLWKMHCWKRDSCFVMKINHNIFKCPCCYFDARLPELQVKERCKKYLGFLSFFFLNEVINIIQSLKCVIFHMEETDILLRRWQFTGFDESSLNTTESTLLSVRGGCLI